MKNKQNQEAENALETQSLIIPDNELEAVAGGSGFLDIDLSWIDRIITVTGYKLQRQCGKCGFDCWQYHYYANHPKGHRWNCAVCNAVSGTVSDVITELTDLPPASYPYYTATVAVPKGGF